ncbi:MAG: proline dehydrogenase family protein [Parachlamydiales bacterium]|nr:proline dehydrogenase family protein [Parachlamydiales bacterium]
MQEKNSELNQILDLLSSVKNSSLSTLDRARKAIEISEGILRLNQIMLQDEQKTVLTDRINLLLDLKGKAFFSNIIDQSFRTSNLSRISNQISYLLRVSKIESLFPWTYKIKFFLFKIFAKSFPKILVPLIQTSLKKELSHTLIYADKPFLKKYLQTKKKYNSFSLITGFCFSKKNIKQNLNYYYDLISTPFIDYIDINIDALYSEKNALSYFSALKTLKENLSKLFKFALKYSSEKKPKTLIITSNYYKNYELSIEAFKSVASDLEFKNLKLGITLCAYFPESLEILKDLIEFSKKRDKDQFSAIIVKIKKGSSFNEEQINAAKNNWISPTFIKKYETDANFKKMLHLSCQKENAKVCNIHISTLNVFDISYSLLLIYENDIEPFVFLFLNSGKIESYRKAISSIYKNTYLNINVINKKDYEVAPSFILKVIDETSNLENFITNVLTLSNNSLKFDELKESFELSINEMKNLSSKPKYAYQKNIETILRNYLSDNEATTDFTLKENRDLACKIAKDASLYKPNHIPLVIDLETIKTNVKGTKIDPCNLDKTLYQYSLADEAQIEKAIKCAKDNEPLWQKIPLDEKFLILDKIIKKIKEKRIDLIKSLMVDIAKNIEEADTEVSSAIDSINYFKEQIRHLYSIKDIKFTPKGTFIVIPPWGFPLSVAIEEIIGALITNNLVILIPPKEAIHICYEIANIIWEAGISKKYLQFLNCNELLFHNKLMKDKRINSVIISTNSQNAKKLIKLREGFELSAECGGINSIIVSAFCDKEQAIQDIISSAFEFSGQKFSSASILILEKEVYEDEEFLSKLKNAAQNLIVDQPTTIDATVTPLAHDLSVDVKKAFTHLGKGESWLLEPKIDSVNNRVMTPGIKLGVTSKSFTKNHEIYAPILSIMKANDLEHAIELANTSKYGLAASLFSLDPREQYIWQKKIQAGNLSINTKITNTKIKKQPFGGYKESAFGKEYKAGGANYLLHFMNIEQIGLPKEKLPVNEWVNSLTAFLEKIDLSAEKLGLWYVSVSNYAYWWKKLKQDYDTCKILGQDNIIRYVPRKLITLRLEEDSFALDALRICAAALTCNMPLEISWSGNKEIEALNWIDLLPILNVLEESKEEFLKRVRSNQIKRLRVIPPASEELKKACANSACCLIDDEVLANGRFELLHYIREVSITYNYDRYGNLGARELELRKPVL